MVLDVSSLDCAALQQGALLSLDTRQIVEAEDLNMTMMGIILEDLK